MDGIVRSVYAELSRFCPELVSKPQLIQWVLENTVTLLQQYPAGISRSVLLTELEYKWNVGARRAEHSGTLKRAMASQQLSLSDVIVADINKLDDNRCILVADGAQSMLIMHRQWFDWIVFLDSIGVEPLEGRRCALTQCRLLKLKPPALLPTATAMFLLRQRDPVEGYLVQDVLQPIYAAWWERCVAPVIATDTATSPPPADVHSAAAAFLTRPGPSPDNSESLVLFAEVLGCDESRRYDERAESTTQFRLVTLRLLDPSQAVAPQARLQQRMSSTEDCVIAYMILFDDQEALARLFQPGDVLAVYRPYLRANAEDTRLFGGTVAAPPGHTLRYEVQHSLDPSLLQFVPSVLPLQHLHFTAFHLLYGSATVLSKVMATEHCGEQRAAEASAPTSQSSCVLRVLSCVEIPASGSSTESDRLVDLWGLVDNSTAGTSSEGPTLGDSVVRLVRVRCFRWQFDAICGSAAKADLSLPFPAHSTISDVQHFLNTTPAFRPGHQLHLSGVRAHHTVSFRAADKERVPEFPLELREMCFHNGVGHSVRIELMNMTWGASPAEAAALYPADGLPQQPQQRSAGSTIAGAAALTNISLLAGLACSPSLFLPVPIAHVLDKAQGLGAGCVLVHAQSIQPLHPSVRTCPGGIGDGVHPSRSREEVGSKRAAPISSEDGTSLQWGYQVMRLRDAEGGEAICLLESVAQIGSAGLQRVQHHLVNTSSTLAFDSCTGQLTRIQPAIAESGGQQGFAVLMSRIDGAVHSPVLQQLRAQRAAVLASKGGSAAGTGSSGAPLPAFRIDVICDMNAAGLAAALSKS